MVEYCIVNSRVIGSNPVIRPFLCGVYSLIGKILNCDFNVKGSNPFEHIMIHIHTYIYIYVCMY